MAKRNVNLFGYCIVFAFLFHSYTLAGRIPMPSVHSEGEVPDIPGIDTEDVRLPFGKPTLGDDEFGLYDDFDAPIFPSEYDYKNVLGEDIGKDSNKPSGSTPESHPEDSSNAGKEPDEDKKVPEEPNADDKPHDHGSGGEVFDSEEPDDHGSGEVFDSEEPDSHVPDEDDIHKDVVEPEDHDSGDVEDHSKKPVDAGSEPDDEHIDGGVVKDVNESPDNSGDDDDDSTDESFHDGKDAEVVPEADSSYEGFVFETPFFNMRQVTKYFQQLEKALEHVFRQSMDEAMLLNGTFANTTEEEIEIDGKKYIVHKSLIKGRDNNSSIYIEALSKILQTNQTEEAKDSGL